MKVIAFDGGAGALGKVWGVGSALYRVARGFDRSLSVASLEQLCAEVARSERPVDEVQIWAHGSPGALIIGGHWYRASELERAKEALASLGRAMAPGGRIWIRSCGTFAGVNGFAFALALSRLTSRTVVGQTHIIGFPWHSGGHALAPGQLPAWDEREGLRSDGRMKRSSPFAPNTVLFSAVDYPSTWGQS